VNLKSLLTFRDRTAGKTAKMPFGFSYSVCFKRSLQKIKSAFYLGLRRLIPNTINMKQLLLAFTGISVLIYLGYYGIENQSESGPFFMFIGVCTAIGLTLDVANVIRQWVRKSNLRKLGIEK
jgi:hypothetical protein